MTRTAERAAPSRRPGPGLDRTLLAQTGEPLRIRARVLALAAEDPELARVEVTRLVTGRLWRSWRPRLTPAGVRASCFRAALDGLGRELWLWSVGDRPWSQVLESAIGRVERRCSAT